MPINWLIINRTHSACPEKSQLIEATRQTQFLPKATEIYVLKMVKSYYETGCLLYCHMYFKYIHTTLNSLLLSLTLTQVNISNSKLDPVLFKHWHSQDEKNYFAFPIHYFCCIWQVFGGFNRPLID